ncbi:caffeic acid 3-O-methyltransferase-like [Gossypium australe]|uniref:Caffeic acid 3-O-methyltransferase-like n=1 Tax=Gossypium australe TaxID=47621 RepID=A0A5B6VHV2_9ROSI|nr:caffeic acid 3-O-methyltransferase-like [Gossypium australe]
MNDSSLFCSSSNHEEEADVLQAMHLATISSLPFTLKVAVDLGLLDIIAKAADTPPGMVSVAEIVSKLPTNNPNAPSIVDRMLRLLAAHSILTCDQITGQDGLTQRSYGLASIGKYFLQNEDGVSFAPLQRFSCKKAFGKHLFELLADDDDMSKSFNQAMSVYTTLVLNQVLETYKGFEGVSQVVDVGGGVGTNLKLIVSKHPQIRGINFDLPQSILHDWGDDRCLKLLKVCYDALPENGKIVSVESIIPEIPETDVITKTIFQRDVALFHILPGAKERTKQELEALAKQAGFSSLKVACRVYNISSNHEEEADVLQAMHLASISSLPFTLKVAVYLGLLEIIAKAADTPSGTLSVSEIVSKLPTNNPDTPSIVDRMLKLFSHSLHRNMQPNHRPRWSHPKIIRPCISRQIFPSK